MSIKFNAKMPSDFVNYVKLSLIMQSMVNLGVASSTASASDLISRDSLDGSAVRKTLTIKEEGKAPTHFVRLDLFSIPFALLTLVFPATW